MNPASSTAPEISAVSTVALVQPSASPRMTPNVIPNNPAPASARPRRSSALSGPCDSVSIRDASGISASPIGTLSQKIHCQEIPSTTAPPTSGPTATPRPLMPPQIPRAAPCLEGGNASETRVSVSGATSAAPNP